MTTTNPETIAAEIERRARLVDEYEKDLLSGKVFFNHYRSQASRYGYEPPVSRRVFGSVMKALGELTTRSEELAYLAGAVIRKSGGLGLTESQFLGSVWKAAEEEVRNGWTDIVLKASPEPGRPSSWDRRYSIGTLLKFYEVVNLAAEGRGPGWTAAELMDRYQVRRES